MTASKGGEIGRDIGSPPKRERGKLEPRNPAFRAALHEGNLLLGERESHHRMQKGAGLLGGEAQLSGSHFTELAACPQASQWQWWVGTSDEDEMHLGRRMLQEEHHTAMDRLGGDEVVVVEHEGKIFHCMVHEIVGQCGEG